MGIDKCCIGFQGQAAYGYRIVCLIFASACPLSLVPNERLQEKAGETEGGLNLDYEYLTVGLSMSGTGGRGCF